MEDVLDAYIFAVMHTDLLESLVGLHDEGNDRLFADCAATTMKALARMLVTGPSVAT
jgi:hypothetical protein